MCDVTAPFVRFGRDHEIESVRTVLRRTVLPASGKERMESVIESAIQGELSADVLPASCMSEDQGERNPSKEIRPVAADPGDVTVPDLPPSSRNASRRRSPKRPRGARDSHAQV